MVDPELRGRFITLEGGEGTGKSTQALRLRGWLAARGIDALTTREPGGSPGAEAIRGLLVNGEPGRWDVVTEALLMNAARRDHVVRTIRPALASGTWVICDRFLDSSRAYQGHAGGMDLADVDALIGIAVDDTRPDLTLILDIDPGSGLARAGGRTSTGADESRFERKGESFHAAVREGFLRIAADEPKRCVLIDAVPDEEAVARSVAAAVAGRFGLTP